jgi:hypothetical protein
MAESVQKVAGQVGQAIGLVDDSPTYTFPDFDSMPPVKDMPQGCAWGFFDKDGKKDELGSKHLKPLCPPITINEGRYNMVADTISTQPPHPRGRTRGE